MAVWEIIAIINDQSNIAASTQLHAGQVVARDSNGNVVAADRALHGTGAYLGILADNTARTGNSKIQVDPVGSSIIDPVTFAFTGNNNGLFAGANRQIGDYQAEDVTGVTNFSASAATGFEGPRRPVGLYTTPSNKLASDQVVNYKTNDTNSSTYADVAFSGGDAYNISSLLTYGTSSNAGKIVLVNPNDNNGKIIGKVDSFDSANNIIYFTQM